MEVKIISGYGENTFQMDDADTMSLLNNAMRFHNKIKAIGGFKDNTDTKAEKEEEINESITAQEFVKKMQEKPHSRNDSLFGTGWKKEPEKTEEPQEVPESVIIPGKNETGNPLIDAELQSKIVGDSLMAYIEVDKDTLKGISEEEYRAFAEEVVRNSGYRWFVIKCGDGTGIVHAGSYYACAVYGKLDTDGCIAEPYGYIYLTDNGFFYEE